MNHGFSRVAAAVLLCCAVCLAPQARAVNLVPNDSFELISSCPTSFGQIYQATPWDTPTLGTPDCYNACVAGFPPLPVPGVPGSPFGFQTARTGVGYAGMIVQQVGDYREYLEVPLISPLVASATYLVKFYVNLSDTCDTAIDRLGAYLSVGPVGPIGNYLPLAFTPQVESPPGTYLTDTVNWMLVSGYFTALGGEDHITLGNFHDNATTSKVLTGNTWPGTNYYVDDVSVELQPPTVQACCTSDGLCSMQFPGECQLLGGTPGGPGTACTPSPCGITPARRSSWGSLKSHYR